MFSLRRRRRLVLMGVPLLGALLLWLYTHPQTGLQTQTLAKEALRHSAERSGTLVMRPSEEWVPLLEATRQEEVWHEELTGGALEGELNRRRAHIASATSHSWKAYVKFAWGHDELLPLSSSSADAFGGLGATMIESLDILWLLGMKREFGQVVKWVADFDFNRDVNVSVVETSTRIMGGLLSAYQLSEQKALLIKAEELAHRLIRAWDTPSGIPCGMVNLARSACANVEEPVTLAQAGGEQLEFAVLASLTGNATFLQKVRKAIQHLETVDPDMGLKPAAISLTTGQATMQSYGLGRVSGDFYQYLLKAWLVTGKADGRSRAMWRQAMDNMLAALMFASSPSRLKYIADFDRGAVQHQSDVSACSIPPMLSLGIRTKAVAGQKALQYAMLTRDLAYACWRLYANHETGLAAQSVKFSPGADFKATARSHHLDPQGMENMFVLWRATRDSRYQHWGWSIFNALVTHCKVDRGFAGLVDVQAGGAKVDVMPSHWLGATLKYALLLYSPQEMLPLDQWVFSSQAPCILTSVMNSQSEMDGQSAF
ncbi:hypothetical protein WJX73_008773 [Symbiochloris irregularis]|uniref:alpha-1,2-Mannosidase n=1 Tax=Symbiochloris irregularis TaxID=706552 RepID=A0AAW1NSQ6_9CHLO